VYFTAQLKNFVTALSSTNEGHALTPLSQVERTDDRQTDRIGKTIRIACWRAIKHKIDFTVFDLRSFLHSPLSNHHFLTNFCKSSFSLSSRTASVIRSLCTEHDAPLQKCYKVLTTRLFKWSNPTEGYWRIADSYWR